MCIWTTRGWYSFVAGRLGRVLRNTGGVWYSWGSSYRITDSPSSSLELERVTVTFQADYPVVSGLT